MLWALKGQVKKPLGGGKNLPFWPGGWDSDLSTDLGQRHAQEVKGIDARSIRPVRCKTRLLERRNSHRTLERITSFGRRTSGKAA